MDACQRLVDRAVVGAAVTAYVDYVGSIVVIRALLYFGK